MSNDSETLRETLRRMPAPEPAPGFVDRVLAHASTVATASGRQPARRSTLLRLARRRREAWLGAALGGAVAAAVTLILLRPIGSIAPGAPASVSGPASTAQARIALTLHEARDVDVLIDSQRLLEDATIRIVTTGSIALAGFEGDGAIGWQTRLERGGNLLALPVVAQSTGNGRLVAVIEHDGRTRQVAVEFVVHERAAEVSSS